MRLGIRHAFRKRGIVHIQAGRAYMPFDVFNVRTIPYHITPEGVPDPAFLDKDKAAISRVTRDTWASDAERGPQSHLQPARRPGGTRPQDTAHSAGNWLLA